MLLNCGRIKFIAPTFVALSTFFSVHAFADSGVTYHGRLLKPNGEPVNSSSVQFRIQIRTPSDSDCLMFEEIQTKDLSGSRGVFSVSIGDGSATVVNTEPFTLADVFRNQRTILFPGGKCIQSSTAVLSATASRQLAVSFNDGSFSGWEPLPSQKIQFLPMAMEAVSVGGHQTSNLFRVHSGSGVPQTMDPWTTANYQKLLDLVGSTTVSGGVASIGGNASGFTGLLSGDVSGGQSLTRVERLQGRDVSNSLPTDGQILKWNNASSRWEPGDIPVAGNPDWTDITNRPTSLPPNGSAGGDLTGTYPNPSISNNAVTAGKIADGAVAFSKIAAGSANGQVLRYESGTGWSPMRLNYADLVNGTGGSPWPGACAAGSFMNWNSGTDAFECVALTNAMVAGALTTLPVSKGGTGATTEQAARNNLGLGTAATKDFGTAAGNLVELDGSGRVPASLLPNQSGTYFTQGGNAFGAPAVLGTTDAQPLHLQTGGTHKLTILDNGNVGIGTTNPSQRLQVFGGIQTNADSTGGILGSVNLEGKNTAAAFTHNTRWSIIHMNEYGGPSGTTGLAFYEYSDGDNDGGYCDADGGACHQRMVIASGGNVGIGTTTPTEKLEVAGNIKATQVCIGTDCRSAWPGTGGGGTVTSVATGTGLTGGPITGSGTISIASGGVGTTQLAAAAVTTAKIGDGQVTGLKLETISGLTNGTYGSSTEIPSITVDTKGRITAISTNTVSALPAAAGVSGKFLKSNGTAWSGQDILFSDIKNSLGSSAFNLAGCGPSKTVQWSSLTDSFSCQDIDNLDAGKITTGTLSASRLPTSITNALWTESSGNVYRASGNVGIGTTSPSTKLQISAEDDKGYFHARVARNAVNGAGLLTSRSRGTLSSPTVLSPNDIITSIYNDGYDGTAFKTSSSLNFMVDGAVSSDIVPGRIEFSTMDTSGLSGPRMTIKNSGNVGIGTSNPVSKLEVNSAANGGPAGLRVNFATRTAAEDATAAIDVIGTSTKGTVFKVEAGGNVGIGTTSPSRKLAVHGTIAVTGSDESYTNVSWQRALEVNHSGAIVWKKGSGDKSWAIGKTSATSDFFIMNSTADDNSAAPNYPFMIESGGNVGIGTYSPGAKLSVLHSAISTYSALIQNTNNVANTYGLGVQVANTATNTYPLIVSSGGTNRLTVRGDGNVGIGTTNPISPLEVSSTTGSNLSLKNPSAGDPWNYIGFYNSTNRRWWAGADNVGNFVIKRDNAAGNILLDGGNVGIGTTSPSYTLHVVGSAGLSTGTAWTNASDARLKDIHGDYERGLDEILQLHTVLYNYKKDNALGLPSDFVKTGFIAQEVQKVIPEAVNQREDGYLELNVDPIHWAVVNAIKGLYKKLVGYRDDVESVKSQVRELQSQNQELKRVLLRQSQDIEEENQELKRVLLQQSQDIEELKRQIKK